MKWFGVIVLSLYFLAASTNARGIARILGGRDVSISQFPYQASIRFFGKHDCGGSIISEKHILTAAHCVNAYDRNTFKFFVSVYTGTSSSVSGGNSHKIADIKVHPGYLGANAMASSYHHDIAVITLQNPIVFDQYQQKINLPSHPPRDGEQAYVTGWGLTSNNSPVQPTRLQMAQMRIITSGECQKMQLLKIHKEQVCALNSEGVGACSGDSGGPLAVNGEVVGIVSFSVEDYCAPGRPDGYTSVYAYMDFINSIINH